MKPPELAPSILSADFSRLGEEVATVERYAGRIHIDVMDGHFVPNLSMGPQVVRSLRPLTDLPLEVHLMVEEPRRFVQPFLEAGADRLIFHREVVEDVSELAGEIRTSGGSAGLALNPETPLETALEVLGGLDLLNVMTVNPGFGGQSFLPEMLDKVTAAQDSVNEGGLEVDIEVDGGVDPETGARARSAGANVFVAGNAIFGVGDPAASARRILQAIGAEEVE
jgi:ribulose-phosphate 3-epimerase